MTDNSNTGGAQKCEGVCAGTYWALGALALVALVGAYMWYDRSKSD